MPEDQFKSERLARDGDNELQRLRFAVQRIESALDRLLADHEALREEHQQLTLDYRALKARNQSVGEELDATIERLRQWMSVAAGSESGEGAWAR